MYEKFKEDIQDGIKATSYEVFQENNCEYIKQSYLNAIDVMIDYLLGIIAGNSKQIIYLQEQRKLIENHD